MRLKIKKRVDPASKIEPNYSGSWRGNFPYKPEYKKSEIIWDRKSLKNLADKLMRVPAFAFDTETNTLDVVGPNENFSLVGISFSWGDDNNYYIPVGHIREEDFDREVPLKDIVKYLRPVFAREDVRIYGWNLKFDMHVLKRVGIDVETEDLFDGILASWLCDENTLNGLKESSATKMHVPQEHFNEVTATVPNSIKKEYGYKSNSRIPFSLVLVEDAAPYAIGDAYYTWCNCMGFVKELEDEGMDQIYYRMYVPFMRVLFDMEEAGVTVDVDELEGMGIEMQKDLDDLQYRIYELAGTEFNIGSSAQKAEILFGFEKPPKEFDPEKLPTKMLKRAYEEKDTGLLEEKGYFLDRRGVLFKKSSSNSALISHSFGFAVENYTKTGNPSTDSDTIWRLSHKQFKSKKKMRGVEMCRLMLEYSKISKLKTAFVDGILEQMYDDGKVHPNFKQTGTDSGRLSCSSPNLQQLPTASDEDKYQIRSVFIGSENESGSRNKIIALDYHNLEMVCLAHFSGDKNLCEMFANDDDAHGSTAVNMFNLDCTPVECKKKYPHLRQAAKTINFMLMYGGGASRLYESLRDDHYSPLDLGSKENLEEYGCRNGVEVAQQFIDKYFESYSGVAKFISDQHRFAHRNGYVHTILGRKRRLPDINSRDMKLQSYSERLSVNATIQGTAGDITINAQIRIAKDERLKELGCRMIIQVHDEIVLECPEENVEEAIQIIKYYMEHPFGDAKSKQVAYLRADADFGDTYQEAK